MTGDHASRAAPLRPADPRRLGRYELIGRLGEGGMGTVYLARDATGRLVAVKMIRADLAPDREFRRRFRSEVDRARLVPPFCTAEVLDADPEHEPPYLVVEYVDGPSLAAVVEDQGPLTPANLHGVAIGVATALTAIHGAGVIHRDLKPTNVLLAPGSPKVIDFGIARMVTPTSDHTGHQMIGTVAYMAPERFEFTGAELTCATDVFAWGAVVAYAGTGRTPFSAQSPPLVAMRILTGPPDLTGLVPPLRDLVERALAKEPQARPSARELLDLLLTTGPTRTPALAAALADQPALRIAAQEAQAATDHGHPGGADPSAPPDAADGCPPSAGLSDATGARDAAPGAPPPVDPAPDTPTPTPDTSAPPDSLSGTSAPSDAIAEGASGSRVAAGGPTPPDAGSAAPTTATPVRARGTAAGPGLPLAGPGAAGRGAPGPGATWGTATRRAGTAPPATGRATTTPPATGRAATTPPAMGRPATASEAVGSTGADPTVAMAKSAEPTAAEPTAVGPTAVRTPDADATIRIPLQREPSSEGPTVAIPTMAPSSAGKRSAGRRRIWKRRLALVLVVVLFTSLTLIGAISGGIPFLRSPGILPTDKPARVWQQTVVQDALTSGRQWTPRTDRRNQATCTPADRPVDSGLLVELQKVGLYRCPGPINLLGDFTMSVDVQLMTPRSCAGVWFRYAQMAGYVLRVCEDGYYLNTHGVPASTDVHTVRTMVFDQPAVPKQTIRVGITVEGD
ncbi:MAG TPA: protein kinase, partial [Catenuloplanes sp.]